MSGILNRTRVKEMCTNPVSSTTEMTDLSRHFKWKYSSMLHSLTKLSTTKSVQTLKWLNMS